MNHKEQTRQRVDATLAWFQARALLPSTIAPRVLWCLRRGLSELSCSALLILRDKRLQIVVQKEKSFSVWAYFPVHRRRWIARQLHPHPQTRVLLVFSEETIGGQTRALTIAQLRCHLGHTFLYLRQPRAQNDCPDAMREWRSMRDVPLRKGNRRAALPAAPRAPASIG